MSLKNITKLLLVFCMIVVCQNWDQYRNYKQWKYNRPYRQKSKKYYGNRDSYFQKYNQKYEPKYKKEDRSNEYRKYEKERSKEKNRQKDRVKQNFKKDLNQKQQSKKQSANRKKVEKVTVIKTEETIIQKFIEDLPEKVEQIQSIPQKIEQLLQIEEPELIQIESVVKQAQQIIEQVKTFASDTVSQQIFDRQNCQQRALYDYNLLVLSWVPEDCYQDKDCQKDWQTYQQLRSPTIHGFRPFGSSSYYQNCFGHRGDQHCWQDGYLTDFDIDEQLWNVSGMLYDISQCWPASKFTHDEADFYFQQWLYHGTCYLMNMIEDNPKAYNLDQKTFNRTIMIQYFRTAMKKYKALNIVVEPGTEYECKQDFAQEIGFKGKQTHFALNCDQQNQIMEITFCFSRSKLPGKQSTIPCTLQDNCLEDKPLKLKKPL